MFNTDKLFTKKYGMCIDKNISICYNLLCIETAPVFEVTALTQQDILNGSDVLIDGSNLFGTGTEN